MRNTGVTKDAKSSKNLKLNGSVDADSRIQKIDYKENERTEFVCSCCGKAYKKQKTNFPAGSSPLYAGNNGYLTICRSCMSELFETLTKFYGNEDQAIERICQLFDLYFNESCLSASTKISKDRNRMLVYISKINIKPHTGKTYSDTIIESRNDSISSIDDIVDLEDHDETKIKEAVSVWGFGFSPEQYKNLDDMFDDWKSRVVIDGKTRESLVRELCIIKLQMNLALQDGNAELYAKLIKTYQEVLRNANLSPLDEDISDKNAEKPIGVMIKMFEDERPIDKCRPEWEDVDHIRKYISIYFLGHICKMLKISNRFSTLYEEEMSKYRVEIPELEDADDEDVFDFLINNGEPDGKEE